MSRPKFTVLKLSDLKLPLIMLALVIAAFSFFLMQGDNTAETFAPDNSYKDGLYIANMAFTDANMDVVVTVAENQIASITLDGFDENEKILYQDLSSSISFVNDYVTSTQSLELPTDSTISTSTSILMDAVNVALSSDEKASVKTTYQAPLLENLSDESLMSEEENVVSEDSTSTEQAPEIVEDTTDTDTAEAAQETPNN